MLDDESTEDEEGRSATWSVCARTTGGGKEEINSTTSDLTKQTATSGVSSPVQATQSHFSDLKSFSTFVSTLALVCVWRHRAAAQISNQAS